MKFAKSRAYVCASTFKNFDYASMISEIKKENSEIDIVIVSGLTTFQEFHSLEQGIREASPIANLDKVVVDPNSVMRMAFTSGMTGVSKRV
jgi:non-ribosomal peptide synthetase component E (peptide arylation enzyme)